MEPAIAPIAIPTFAPMGSPSSLSLNAVLSVCEAVGWLVPSIVVEIDGVFVALGCPFPLFGLVVDAEVDRGASLGDSAVVDCNAYFVVCWLAIDVMLNIGPFTADLYES
jgi:hypothetical protein